MAKPKFDVDGTTLAQLIDLVAAQYGDNRALVYHRSGIDHSYAVFREICNTVAKGFMSLGVEKGEHIAIWANNVPQWVYTQFGTAKMGAVLVTVNTHYRSFELEYLMKQSDATTLVMIGGVREQDEYLKVIHELCPELADSRPGELTSARLPKLKNVIFIGNADQPGMFAWGDMMARGHTVSDDALTERQQSLRPEDAINMQYTSGTTGFPKGVMLTHKNIIGNAVSIGACMQLSAADTLCIPVPLFHCFGCVLGTLTCVVSGAAMAPLENFDPVEVLETVQATQSTALHGVPTMFIAELEALETRAYDLSTLRTGIMAGSPCPIEVMKKVVDPSVMGAREMTIAYGQTESSPVITQTRPDDDLSLRVGTVGRALPNVEVKVVDPDNGKDLSFDCQGELCTRGYHVMKGYYRMPEATAAAIDEDGWLHTGDLATMDVNGNCKITGRIKDMIIRGGENIYPREIEEFLYTHPEIKDAQVVGVPSEKYGEEVVAYVQPKRSQAVTASEIRSFCTDKIAFHKIPAHFFFVEEYPTTASGKIQKYKLREAATLALERSRDAQIETA